MTTPDERTFVDQHVSGVDSQVWSGIVDAVLPIIWEITSERQLSTAHAAVVCDASLLFLLDGWERTPYDVEDALSRTALLIEIRRRAGVECERMRRLSERRSLTGSGIVMPGQRRREEARR